MKYIIDDNALMENVKEEISRVGLRSYSTEGISLYDGIKVTSRDNNTLNRIMSSLKTRIISRFRFFIDSSSDSIINFNLPDLPSGYDESIIQELNTFLTMGVVAVWLEEKGVEESKNYLARSLASLETAENLLTTRSQLMRG